ncbi:MAG: hypothetical protein MJY71_08775 [Bacteroidaceae bacterium]|nr:hypothetical protein [Bacteroidaceae bacterium]
MERNWKGTTGGGKIGQTALIWIFKAVRPDFLYPLLYLIIPFYMLFAHKGYIVTYQYFKQIHGYGTFKAFISTYLNHVVFGKVVLDKFALLAGRKFPVEIANNYNPVDIDKAAIIAGAHVGNFELCGHCVNHCGKKIYSLVYGGESMVLQQKRTQAISNFGVELISVQPDMSHIFTLSNALSEGNFAAMACDRAFGSSKCFSMQFCGILAEFPMGPFALAAKTECNIYTINIIKGKRLGYKLYIEQLDTASNEYSDKKSIRSKAEYICSQYVRSLEKIVMQYPLQWFNYYQFWKPVPAQDLLPQKDPMVMIDNLISCDSQTAVALFTVKDGNIFCNNDTFVSAGLLEVFAQTAAARIGWLNRDNIKIGTIGGVSRLDISKNKIKIGQKIISTITVLSEMDQALVLDGTITDTKGTVIATCSSLKVFING